MSNNVWKNGTMYTKWERKYKRTHTDGTQELITLERVDLVHPRLNQIMAQEYGPVVKSRSVQLYRSKTGKAVKPRNHYYTLSQIFHGGPGAQADPLGGFCSGAFRTYYRDCDARNVEKDLIKEGYTLD